MKRTARAASPWETAILAAVFAPQWNPAPQRQLRHLLNVPRHDAEAFRVAIEDLVARGRLRLGARDRIEPGLPAAAAPVRQARKAETPKLPRMASAHRIRDQEPAEPCPPWGTLVASFEQDHELPLEFPVAVRREVAQLKEPGPVDFEGRIDLRDQKVCTIDPHDARDHDDAVFVEDHEKGGWILWVHIADVGHYVQEGSAVDRTALRRSFTQYLPWGAYPMLPERLSSDLCSLIEGVDRLAFTCRMQVSGEGVISGWSFMPTIVRVRRFLAYEKAQELADRGDAELLRLRACADALLARRSRENLLGFEMPEARVRFGADGSPESAGPSQRLDAHRWIEEAMLAANRCCARALARDDVPGLHRVHEPPDEEALQAIALWARQSGLPTARIEQASASDCNIRPALQAWLSRLLGAEGLPLGLQGRILRSLKKARYAATPDGHFALGWRDYAHFTSPIRRYPDLWTHRVLRAQVSRTPAPPGWKSLARQVAAHSSGREEIVQKCERAGMRTCLAWILRDRAGERFEGEIVGVEPMGIFVQIRDPWAEGMVHVRRMFDDHYEHDPNRMELRGTRHGRILSLGQKLTVELVRADPVRAMVDFGWPREEGPVRSSPGIHPPNAKTARKQDDKDASGFRPSRKRVTPRSRRR